MAVSECARYKCDVCGKEVHLSVDEGIPEGWGILRPAFQHPEGRHMCDVCMGPLKKMREVYQEARQVFLDACEAAGKGKLEGPQIAKGLEGDWEDGGDAIL